MFILVGDEGRGTVSGIFSCCFEHLLKKKSYVVGSGCGLHHMRLASSFMQLNSMGSILEYLAVVSRSFFIFTGYPADFARASLVTGSQ